MSTSSYIRKKTSFDQMVELLHTYQDKCKSLRTACTKNSENIQRLSIYLEVIEDMNNILDDPSNFEPEYIE